MNEMRRIYVDHAATTRLSDRAFDEMVKYLKNEYANPSTLYSSARVPRQAIASARRQIAECIGADASEIVFTSCGTESDNWAIKHIAFQKDTGRRKIITSQIEHHAILNSCKVMEKLGFQVVYLPVDKEGIVSSELLKRELDEETALVSIMLVNNEIGTIQNIRELSDLAHEKGALFHTDAVQAVGHIEVDVGRLGIDLLSASAHKFNGPKGVGFLYIRDGVALDPYISGGAQENGSRAGTENVAGIVGMAAALQENVDDLQRHREHLSELEELFIRLLKDKKLDFRINGAKDKSPGILSVSFADMDGEMILHRLDLKGIQIATGSACDSKETQISHVVRAISVPERYARGTVRFSFGSDNTCEDIIYIADELMRIAGSRKKAGE